MSYTALDITTPKARKEHACTYCGEKILIGSTYYREKGVYDGGMQSLAYHPECEKQQTIDHQGEGEYEIDPFEHSPRPTTTNTQP